MLSEEVIKKHLYNKENVDRLRLNYLFDEDLEVCDYVVSQIPYINIESINPGNVVSLDELIILSLEEMKIFGDDIYLRVKNLSSKVPISMQYDYFFKFQYVVSFNVLNNGVIDYNSGKNEKYVIPKELYELSIFLFSHEHIHSLKETNYYEQIDTFREVIPLFYELIIFNPNEVLKRELLRCRLSWLLGNRNEFVKYNNLIKNKIIVDNSFGNEVDFCARGGLYDYFRLLVGLYLNSFYYAMILYSMYKETPKKILDLVSKVLKQEMTTLQMLESLGLYGDIRGEIFEKEMKNIRRFIK